RALDRVVQCSKYAATCLQACALTLVSAGALARAVLAAAALLGVMRLRARLLVVRAARLLSAAAHAAANVAGAGRAALHLWRAGHAAAAALALKLLFLAAFGLRGALLLTRLSVGERSRTDGEGRNSRESQRCHAHVCFLLGFNPWCKPTRRPWLSS